jgi:glycosyltransferase involved in cell wall biosynthesis
MSVTPRGRQLNVSNTDTDSSGRKLVIFNQAANYLTVGYANAFKERFDEVALIVGSVHVHGAELNPEMDFTERDAMFLPTLAECFSASYAEAMVMGKPIFATHLGFARSICGSAALYYRPCDPKAAAETIARLILNSDTQVRLREAGQLRVRDFDTPSGRAKKILGICTALTGSISAVLSGDKIKW